MKNNVIFILMLIFAFWGCEKEQLTELVAPSDTEFIKGAINNEDYNFVPPFFNPVLTYGSVTDIDGNVYKTIQIGNQTWMAENLRTTRNNDGNLILMGTGGMAGETDWFDLEIGALCWYNNDSTNKWMGAIYNWHALETGKLAPAGWHVPNNSEWRTLIDYLGGETPAYRKLLSSGTNESGFTAVVAGGLSGWGFGPELAFWSADPYLNPYAFKPYANELLFWSENGVEKVSLQSEPQSYGFTVRCIKD